MEDNKKFEKSVVKLKIVSSIVVVSLTFLGAMGAYTLNTVLDIAKSTTEYAEKCQKETNEDIKNVYKKFFETVEESVNIMLGINFYLTLILLPVLVISFFSSLYLTFKVFRL